MDNPAINPKKIVKSKKPGKILANRGSDLKAPAFKNKAKVISGCLNNKYEKIRKNVTRAMLIKSKTK